MTGTHDPGGSCTADLHRYTELVAVDRARLPASASVRTTAIAVDGSRVDTVTVLHAR